MSIVAGTLRELSAEHPVHGSFVFSPKKEEDHPMQEGGFKSNDDDGNFTADGQRIDQIDPYPWSLEVVVGNTPGAQTYLKKLQGDPTEAQWNARFANGDVRTGQGKPVGDVVQNYMAGTLPYKIAGSGEFELVS